MPRPKRKTRDKFSRAGEVPGWRRWGKRGGGEPRKRKIFTIKAGMCMKTKETKTKCLKKVGHLCLRFGHFCLTDTSFAENRRLYCHFCALRNAFLASKCRNVRGGQALSPTPRGCSQVGSKSAWPRPRSLFSRRYRRIGKSRLACCARMIMSPTVPDRNVP